MFESIPNSIKFVLDRIESAGHEVFLVGGCVRDAAMSKAPHDFDLTTSATPPRMLEIFSDMRVIETGLRHGTLTVVSDGEQVEVTTYRIDGAYSDNRHPESVSFTDDITLDLSRRDFTVNAMAYSPTRGIRDPFGGMDDIKNRRIMCVGVAEDRFTEDGLRILRALRFASVLDFEIEEKTAAAVRGMAGLLRGISRERVQVETYKLICGVGAARIMRDFAEAMGLCLDGVTPEAIRTAADGIGALSADAVVRLSHVFALAFDGESARERTVSAMKSLRASTADTARAARLVEAVAEPLPLDTAGIRRLMGRMGEDDIRAVHELRGVLHGDADGFIGRYDEVRAISPCVRVSELAVNGRDVMAETSRRGTMIGATLDELLELVITDRLPSDREAQLEYLRSIDK